MWIQSAPVLNTVCVIPVQQSFFDLIYGLCHFAGLWYSIFLPRSSEFVCALGEIFRERTLFLWVRISFRNSCVLQITESIRKRCMQMRHMTTGLENSCWPLPAICCTKHFTRNSISVWDPNCFISRKADSVFLCTLLSSAIHGSKSIAGWFTKAGNHLKNSNQKELNMGFGVKKQIGIPIPGKILQCSCNCFQGFERKRQGTTMKKEGK